MTPTRVYPVRPEPRKVRKTHPLAAAPGPLSLFPAKADLWTRVPSVIPPIRNQGAEGSCTGHGWAHAAEILRRTQGFAPLDLSEQFIYNVERIGEGDLAADAGAQIGAGATVLEQFGVCEEQFWTYGVENLFKRPSDAAYAAALEHRLTGHARLLTMPEAVISEIAAGRAVVFGMTVFSSFETDQVTRTGLVPMPASGERQLGGHCMTFTGYEVTKAATGHQNAIVAFLRRLIGLPPAGASEGFLWADNSWGDGWGIGGRCKIPFEVVRKYCFDLTAPRQMAS